VDVEKGPGSARGKSSQRPVERGWVRIDLHVEEVRNDRHVLAEEAFHLGDVLHSLGRRQRRQPRFKRAVVVGIGPPAVI
jgi:hypothetical protein